MFYDGGMADLARRQPDDYSDWLNNAQTGTALDPAPGRGYAMPRISHFAQAQAMVYAISREGYAYLLYQMPYIHFHHFVASPNTTLHS